ncbi:CJH_07325 family protein [Campylobacter coli]
MEKLVKSVQGRVGFINIPCFNVGNTCDTIQTTSNNELDKMLENLERDLIEDRKKFKMDEFFANAKF